MNRSKQQTMRLGMTKLHMDLNVGTAERIISSILGGAILALGLTRKSILGGIAALIGGELVVRGISGHCPVYSALDVTTDTTDGGPVDMRLRTRGIKVDKSITINRPAAELYDYWRNFANLPHFMQHVKSVEVLDELRSRWSVEGPTGRTLHWDAEIVDDQPGRLIGWHSLPGADIDSAGVVLFLEAPADRGTEVHVVMRYAAPSGKLGATLARLLGRDPATDVQENLRCFKTIMETGAQPTVDGQPQGGGNGTDNSENEKRFGWGSRDIVDQASWESFPASDAPAY